MERYFDLNFFLTCPKNTTEEKLTKFENELLDTLVELVEKYDFSVSGGMVEVDENGNRV